MGWNYCQATIALLYGSGLDRGHGHSPTGIRRAGPGNPASPFLRQTYSHPMQKRPMSADMKTPGAMNPYLVKPSATLRGPSA